MTGRNWMIAVLAVGLGTSLVLAQERQPIETSMIRYIVKFPSGDILAMLRIGDQACFGKPDSCALVAVQGGNQRTYAWQTPSTSSNRWEYGHVETAKKLQAGDSPPNLRGDYLFYQRVPSRRRVQQPTGEWLEFDELTDVYVSRQDYSKTVQKLSGIVIHLKGTAHGDTLQLEAKAPLTVIVPRRSTK